MKMFTITSSGKRSFFDNFEVRFSEKINPSCLLPTPDIAYDIISNYELDAVVRVVWISGTDKYNGEIISFEFLDEQVD